MELFNLKITNTAVLTLVIGLFVFILFFLCFRKPRLIPRRWQNFGEWILEKLYNYFDSITQNKQKTREIFPLAATLFILILSCNLLELAPGLGVFPILRSPSSDLNFTLALAIFSIVFINLAALKKLGFFSYLKKFINLKNPILFFVGVLESIGELVRVCSLAIRLFGNLLAGEILLMVVSFLFAYILPLPFLGLEILVAFIQALIFSSLIVIFYSTAVEHLEH